MTEAQTYAWIFLSVPDDPVPLQQVIAMADGINHAIPTQKELQASFGWLIARGLIKKEGKHYSLTEEGRLLRKASSSKTMMETWGAVTLKLSRFKTAESPKDEVSAPEIASAYTGYKNWFRSTYEKLVK